MSATAQEMCIYRADVGLAFPVQGRGSKIGGSQVALRLERKCHLVAAMPHCLCVDLVMSLCPPSVLALT